MLNHVLTYTEKEKLHFVGHSMGSTTFMVTKSSMYPFQYRLDNVCQFKHIMRHTLFMVTKSSTEVIQKPNNLHKYEFHCRCWTPWSQTGETTSVWLSCLLLWPTLTTPLRLSGPAFVSVKMQSRCNSAPHNSVKFQADRRVLPVVPMGRRPHGTCGVSSLNLVSQPHGRLRLRGPCTWFILFCFVIFFLCISS